MSYVFSSGVSAVVMFSSKAMDYNNSLWPNSRSTALNLEHVATRPRFGLSLLPRRVSLELAMFSFLLPWVWHR